MKEVEIRNITETSHYLLETLRKLQLIKLHTWQKAAVQLTWIGFAFWEKERDE
jgi:hypothetical protein